MVTSRWIGDKKETVSEEDTTIVVDYSGHGVRKTSRYTLLNPSNDPSLRLSCSAAITDLESTMDSPVMDIAFICKYTDRFIHYSNPVLSRSPNRDVHIRS